MQRAFLPADLEPCLARHGINRCVVMQSAPHEDETLWLMQLTAGLPWVHGIVGWSDLESPLLPDRLRALQSAGPLLGLRVMLNRLDDSAWISRSEVLRGLRILAAEGLSLDLIAETRHLGSIREALLQVPQLRAVVNHGATPPIARGPMSSWIDGITALARDTQVWCKFSGLAEAALPLQAPEALLPAAEHLWHCFGPDRLLFASNWPVCDRARGFDAWWVQFHELLDHLCIDDSQRVAMLGGNAQQVYRLPTQPL